MTLHHFLDAAYTILVEEYQRLGVNLMEALEKNEMWRASVEKNDVVISEVAVARQNENAMAQFEQMMKGVSV